MELLTNPIIWLLVAIIIVAVIETKKSKKCSTKSKGANKTSYATKPTYASSGLPKQKKTPTRARTKKGKFVADDPTTPQNEAWEGGKAPTKKRATRKTAKKRVAKKTTTKKSSAKKN